MPGSNGLVGAISKSPSPLDYLTFTRTGKSIMGILKADGADSRWWSGNYYLSGTVKVGTTLVQRRVRLYEHLTGKLLLEKLANADGTYAFNYLRGDLLYTVSATDSTDTYDDVIAARVTPLLMP